jgi:hypothetical protein
LIALDGVPDELKNPPDDEERERPTPTEKEERQTHDDHRDADAMRQTIQRVRVLRLVIFHE